MGDWFVDQPAAVQAAGLVRTLYMHAYAGNRAAAVMTDQLLGGSAKGFKLLGLHVQRRQACSAVAPSCTLYRNMLVC
jgi:hypothetical protein